MSHARPNQTKPNSLSLSLPIYIYIKRERKSEWEREREREHLLVWWLVSWFVVRHINNPRVIYRRIKFRTIPLSISLDFVYKQLNGKMVVFHTIQFSISTQFSSIWPIDRTLSCVNTPGQSGPRSDDNEGVLNIFQSSRITGTSSSDCLVSYPGHPLLGWALTPQQIISRCFLLLKPTGQLFVWGSLINLPFFRQSKWYVSSVFTFFSYSIWTLENKKKISLTFSEKSFLLSTVSLDDNLNERLV